MDLNLQFPSVSSSRVGFGCGGCSHGVPVFTFPESVVGMDHQMSLLSDPQTIFQLSLSNATVHWLADCGTCPGWARHPVSVIGSFSLLAASGSHFLCCSTDDRVIHGNTARHSSAQLLVPWRNCKFKASLDYTSRPCLKQTNQWKCMGRLL